MSEPRKLSSYVEPPLTDARLDAQWSRISERLPTVSSGRSRLWLPAAGLAVAAALTVVWLKPGTQEPSAWEGSVVASDDSPVEMTLAEGSLVELSPRSEVELLRSSQDSVELRLSEGSARFAVSADRSRRFSVRSGPVEVVVRGTEFRLTRSRAAGGEHVRIDVEEGTAEVARHDAQASRVKLVKGEHWSTFVAYEKTSQVREESGSLKPVAETSEADEDKSATEAALPFASDEPRRAQRTRRPADGAAAELLDRANLARRAGQMREASELYAEIVQRFPKDRSAALSAFELGRIRMDALSDPRGAVQAFERALALDARRAFAEDALARLALAHDATGDGAACKRAKERYLAKYPEGVHVEMLSRRCP